MPRLTPPPPSPLQTQQPRRAAAAAAARTPHVESEEPEGEEAGEEVGGTSFLFFVQEKSSRFLFACSLPTSLPPPSSPFSNPIPNPNPYTYTRTGVHVHVQKHKTLLNLNNQPTTKQELQARAEAAADEEALWRQFLSCHAGVREPVRKQMNKLRALFQRGAHQEVMSGWVGEFVVDGGCC